MFRRAVWVAAAFGVLDAAPCAHPLQPTRAYNFLVAEAVCVTATAFLDVGNNVEAAVWVPAHMALT